MVGKKNRVFHLMKLLPVMWTCVRCPDGQLDQRRKCWQGLPGAVSYWPSSLAPFLAKREKEEDVCHQKYGKIEQKKQTLTTHIGSHPPKQKAFCFPTSEPQSNYTKLEKLPCADLMAPLRISVIWIKETEVYLDSGKCGIWWFMSFCASLRLC